MKNFNIACRLDEQVELHANRIAISFPIRSAEKYKYSEMSFQELQIKSFQVANAMKELGLKKGDKVLIFIRPCLEFSAFTFGLFRAGLVPIFIDPGMGRKNLLRAVEQIAPKALFAEKQVHWLRRFFPKAFSSIKYFINNSAWTLGSELSLPKIISKASKRPWTENVSKDDQAAILFTSGGTGIPKGVLYTHQIFNSQIDLLKDTFSLTPNDIDIPGFPLFSLLTVAMGMKSSIPDMNPALPSKCNPKRLVQNILDQKATFLAGSPAIWERVGDYCLAHNITLPTVKYLVMFGAPVRLEVHQALLKIIPNGNTYTPYGATECLPVSNISGQEILNGPHELMNKGMGTYLGHSIKGVSIKIIPITEEIISNIEEIDSLAPYELGEIIVQGPTVTTEYIGMEQKTKEAKIKDTLGNTWHRMGDIGYLDEHEGLWFGGRKSHRIQHNDQVLSSVQCEAIFNKHPSVEKSALVYRRTQRDPVIIVQRKDQKILKGRRKDEFKKELLELANQTDKTQEIKEIYQAKSFPVDVRHNIKIDRLQMSRDLEKGLFK